MTLPFRHGIAKVFEGLLGAILSGVTLVRQRENKVASDCSE